MEASDAQDQTRLPGGVVSFVLGDVVGSVRLWERDHAAMASAAVRLDELVDELTAHHGGVRPAEQGEGDSFVLAFDRASEAVACALDVQLAVVGEPWRNELDLNLRMGIHAGEIEMRDGENYAGPTLNRCARLRDLAGGRQVLLSHAAYDLAAERMPRAAQVRDVGVHELRDMARAEHVYQLLHPELSGATPPGLARRSNGGLPTSSTSFVGRTREQDEIRRVLDDTRLLTLAGAGGSGKTRLALEIAATLQHSHGDCVRWIDLTPLTRPDLVAASVAAAVAVDALPARLDVNAVVEVVRDRSLLLVLDNCEHLIEASADLVGSVLRSCPNVRVIVTSREPLGVDGETTYRVPSLGVPMPDCYDARRVAQTDAVRLFVERARQVRPSFELDQNSAAAVGEICRRLDGMPLAIELAAARIRHLPASRIATDLSDRFRLLTGGPRGVLPRQRTLEASVAWSYDLLVDEERLTLARLSVFAGSFSLDAAEAVCADATVEAYRVLDIIGRLADRSLVQVEDCPDEPMYRLLETIRAYVRERLAELDDAERVRHRHLDHFVHRSHRGRDRLTTDFELEVAALGRAVDDMRTAMDWALASGRPMSVLEIVEPVFQFWLVRGLYHEVHGRLVDAMSSAKGERGERLRGLVTSSLLAVLAGQYGAAFDLGERSVALVEADDDAPVRSLSHTYRAWGGLLSGHGSNEQIWSDLDQALRLAESSGDAATLARIQMFAGTINGFGRSIPAGRDLLGTALELITTQDLPYFDVPVHTYLGLVSLFAGDLDATRRHGEQAVRLGHDIGFDSMVAQALMGLGVLAAVQGDATGSARLFGESRRTIQDARLESFETIRSTWEAFALSMSGDTRETAATAERALRAAAAIGDRMSVAWAALNAGTAAARLGDIEAARAHLESARAHSTEPAFPGCHGRATQELANLSLHDGDLDAAWELAHDALDTLVRYGERLGIPASLETVAAVAAKVGMSEMAARLLGASARIHQELGTRRSALELDRQAATLSATRANTTESFDGLWTEGRALSADDAVAYARRGRGERGRPSIGWSSLTPAELEVVRHVIQGMSNPEIAKQLFVTTNTIKTHLSHIYTKLDVSGRAELAAQAGRRGDL